MLVVVGGLAVAGAAGTLSWAWMRRRLETGAITRLPNRHVFERVLDDALARPGAACDLVMALVDLDDLKRVDVELGRRATDRLVRECVALWRERLAGKADLYDLERGRFAVLLAGVTDTEALRVVDDLRAGLPYPGTVSAGLGRCRPGDTLALLTTRAGGSLHRAKVAGKDCVDPDAWTLVAADDIRRGLAAGEFFVVYQPIVMLGDGTVVGCEALLRWAHPQRGPVPPSEFVPAAEAGDVIEELDRFTLETAVGTLAACPLPAAAGLRLGVNVTSADLETPGYAASVLALLDRAGLAPERLVLEVTESTVGADRGAAVEALRELHRAGVRIAVDDFGTGYSSLARIGTLPLDILKIDRSFVVDDSPAGEALLAAIVALGKALDVDVVAEGIEAPDQAQRLQRLGCRVGQGYLLGRPLGWSRLEAALALRGAAVRTPRA